MDKLGRQAHRRSRSKKKLDKPPRKTLDGGLWKPTKAPGRKVGDNPDYPPPLLRLKEDPEQPLRHLKAPPPTLGESGLETRWLVRSMGDLQGNGCLGPSKGSPLPCVLWGSRPVDFAR